MTNYARWQSTITDDEGNVQPGASIEVRLESVGAPLATLYSDRTGLAPIGNPVVADADGFVYFHVTGGAYKITASFDGDTRIWRYVPVGLAQESDGSVSGGTTGFLAKYASATTLAVSILYDNGTRVALGTTSPDALFSVNGVVSFGAGAAALPSIAAFGDLDTGFWFPAANTLAGSTAGAERWRIDSSGNISLNALAAAATYNAGAETPRVQNPGTSASTAAMGIARHSADTGGALLHLAKSRHATAGSHTIVQSGDVLGAVNFAGSDGTNFVNGAQIKGESDGTPGASNDMPGRIVFSTTADGSGTLTERMRIGNAGDITFGVSGTRLFWDSTNRRLGLGTLTPGRDLEIFGGSRIALTNSTTGGGAAKGFELVIAGANAFFYNYATGGTMIFGTQASDVQTITAAGLTGFGTGSPDAKVTVNGVASFGAGAANLPSIAAFGDLDTGFWFPAANTLAGSTAGAERWRIDSAGNVKIGGTAARGTTESQGALCLFNASQAPVGTLSNGVSLYSASGVLKAMDAAGNAISLDTHLLHDDTSATLAKGFYETPYSNGTVSSGTLTPDAGNNNLQYYTNNGAHTLAPPSAASSILMEITNGASAGAITTSGFTKVTGDAFTTTNAHKFLCTIVKSQTYSLLNIVALQ